MTFRTATQEKNGRRQRDFPLPRRTMSKNQTDFHGGPGRGNCDRRLRNKAGSKHSGSIYQTSLAVKKFLPIARRYERREQIIAPAAGMP